VLQDRLLLSQEKMEKLKMALESKMPTIDDQPDNSKNPQVSPPIACPQSADLPEESEEVEGTTWAKVEKVASIYLSDPTSVKQLTSLDQSELESLHNECKMNIEKTTWDGVPRRKDSTSTPIPTLAFLLLTLFWLKHYPTYSVLSAIFCIHPRTLTRVLKRTTAALAKLLKMKFLFLQKMNLHQKCTHFDRIQGSLPLFVSLMELKSRFLAHLTAILRGPPGVVKNTKMP